MGGQDSRLPAVTVAETRSVERHLRVADLRDRGEREVFGEVLRRALVAQDGERRTRRVVVTAPPEDGGTTS